jgi:Sigma-70 factor, region 1.1
MDASDDVLAVEPTDAIDVIEAVDLAVALSHLVPVEEPDAAISGGASAERSVISIEELREAVGARGREHGFVTSDELLEALPVGDLAPEQVEEFLTQVERYLLEEGIEVLDAGLEEPDPDPEVLDLRLPREDAVLRAPTTDPVRMYLRGSARFRSSPRHRRSTWRCGSRAGSSPPS